ncbi:MAG TPA: urease accessory protein UreF [Burkholderiales bacterium]|nr:urease accessory protein UreF [Burkholderiales bacterium]
MSTQQFDNWALARLLRLCSPMLPVGAFSYSQGLESAAELGWLSDEVSARSWIGAALTHSVGCFEAPIWCRLYRAWQAPDAQAVADWNEIFLAGRESAEFRAETLQMGYSLRALLLEGAEFDDAQIAALRALENPGFPAAFSFACAAWRIPEREGLLGYLWAWLENQVAAAMKTIPLGQTAGQRLLAALGGALPEVTETTLRMADDEMSNCAPSLAIASCRHETQYSRLFRS